VSVAQPIRTVPGHETFRHVQVDGVQRHVVHVGRHVDDDVHLAVERGVPGPQERYHAQAVRLRDDARGQTDVRGPDVGLQPLVVHAADLVQYRLGGRERRAAVVAVQLAARAQAEEEEQAQGAQEHDERERRRQQRPGRPEGFPAPRRHRRVRRVTVHRWSVSLVNTAQVTKFHYYYYHYYCYYYYYYKSVNITSHIIC